MLRLAAVVADAAADADASGSIGAVSVAAAAALSASRNKTAYKYQDFRPNIGTYLPPFPILRTALTRDHLCEVFFDFQRRPKKQHQLPPNFHRYIQHK